MSLERAELDVIRSPGELAALEPELERLYGSASDASPFQSPAWLLSWAECLAEPGSLRVVVCRHDGELIGVLPLVREPDGVLRFLGHGISDYLDVLVRPAAAATAVPSLLASLRELAGRAERCELSDVPPDSALLRSAPGAPRLERRTGVVCPKLELAGNFASYVASLPGWLARNVRQGEARLERVGATSFAPATVEELPAAVDLFFELHAARAGVKGGGGVLAHPAVREFHRRAAPRLVAAGLLELCVLRAAGRPIGVAHVLVRRDAHLYLTGFDPSFARFNPGSLLILRSIQRAFEAKRERYDFLRGNEPYKYAWRAHDEATLELSLSTAARAAALPEIRS